MTGSWEQATEADSRLTTRVASEFDEFLVLRFRATNESSFPFEWLDTHQTEMDYRAVLTRILWKYEARF